MSHVSEVAELSERLLTAQAERSRLIGWTVLVCHFPDRLDSSELENKVLYYAALSNDDNLFIRPNHDDSLIRPMASLLYRGPDRELFGLFLINALEALLENLTVVRQDKLFAAIGKLQALRTRDSMIRLENLLRQIGRRDALSMFGEMFGTFNWDISESDARHRTLFQDVLVGAFVDEEVLTPPNTSMKHFGAFLQLAGVMEVPVSDEIKAWKDVGDLLRVRELLRVAAIIFGLSLERLAAEVQQFYEGAGTQKRFRGFSVVNMVSVCRYC